jgi:4a-hydroxytetrahydrobiopterin dehydratase
MRCVACRSDAPTVTEAEIAELQPQVREWEITEQDGIKKLSRAFRFDDFAKALAFTNALGELAEEEDHHPALLTEWGRVTVTWWTHKIRGLHRNDFVMAAKADELYCGSTSRTGSSTEPASAAGQTQRQSPDAATRRSGSDPPRACR